MVMFVLLLCAHLVSHVYNKVIRHNNVFEQEFFIPPRLIYLHSDIVCSFKQ